MDIKIIDFSADNLSSIVKWRNDNEVNKFLRSGYRTIQEVSDWYNNFFLKEQNKLLALYADDELIGYCSIENIDLKNSNCEIGIVIGEKQYWNKGIGVSSVKKLTNMVFSKYKMHRVYAVIKGGNNASISCFQKAGFKHEGTFRDARFENNVFIDINYYAVLDNEWGNN